MSQRSPWSAVGLMLVLMAASATVLLSSNAEASSPDEPVQFGMDVYSMQAQANRGVAADLGSFWIGPWTLEHGWHHPDQHMQDARQQGVTPMIHFYYWGDDISQDCIENGCHSDLHDEPKNQENWQKLASQLVDHLHQEMKGEEVVIVLETEFNKNDVTTYEPLDTYLTEKANYIQDNYANAKIVLGLGNWGHGDWDTWDSAAAASDWIGIQAMRGSTQDSESSYLGAFDDVLQGTRTAEDLFGKPVILTDMALSTYPEPEYLEHQRTVLEETFDRFDELKQAGLRAMVYRSLWDNPDFDTANYYGEAEKHWGLVWSDNNTDKPSFDVWKQGVVAEREGAAGGTGDANLPRVGSGQNVQIEAESFEAQDAGGAEEDARASGGTRWNLWANGSVSQRVHLEQTGPHEITLRADGHEAKDAGPHMEVQWNDQPILQTEIPAGGYENYTTQIDAEKTGEHTLSITYTNDRWTPDGDRNLLLDEVTIGPLSPEGNAGKSDGSDGSNASRAGGGGGGGGGGGAAPVAGSSSTDDDGETNPNETASASGGTDNASTNETNTSVSLGGESMAFVDPFTTGEDGSDSEEIAPFGLEEPVSRLASEASPGDETNATVTPSNDQAFSVESDGGGGWAWVLWILVPATVLGVRRR